MTSLANGCTGDQVLGALMRGGSLLFGMRVELAWPEGMPPGMTEDYLRDLGFQICPGEQPRWVLADAGFCDAMTRCWLPLDGGRCERHGERP